MGGSEGGQKDSGAGETRGWGPGQENEDRSFVVIETLVDNEKLHRFQYILIIHDYFHNTTVGNSKSHVIY